MHQDEWTGCYKDSWQGLLTPEAFAHPAKVAPGLSARIFDHARDEGWLPRGSICLDPFSGIGGFALQALLHGCAYIGVELEAKFFRLSQDNLSLWIHAYRHLPGFGPWAVLHLGDSRRLGEVLGRQVGCCVSSPPYAESLNTAKDGIDWTRMQGGTRNRTRETMYGAHGVGGIAAQHYGDTPGNLGALPAGHVEAALCVSSPPFSEPGMQPSAFRQHIRAAYAAGQTKSPQPANQSFVTPGNLGNLPLGCVVSSPPFASTTASDWHLDSSPERFEKLYANYKVNGGGMSREQFRAHCEKRQPSYGRTPGNLATMVCSSPPYADGCTHTGGADPQPQHVQGGAVRHVAYGETTGQLSNMVVSSPPFMSSDNRDADKKTFAYKFHGNQRYGNERPSLGGIGGDRNSTKAQGKRLQHVESIANLGNIVSEGNNGQLINTDTFWSAARQVLEGVYAVLQPGGHAIWVIKDYCRNGKIVPFTQQWQALTEACGFVTLHRHHALLTEEYGTQATLFGGADEQITVKRASFFRRLHERKRPDLSIDFEVVLCTQKPH